MRNISKFALPLTAVITAIMIAACSGSGGSSNSKISGKVTIDGSSTVYPLTATAAESFQAENSEVRITVGTSGTGGGFEKFCRGEIDANDASRKIKPEEAQACADNGIQFGELQIATDALTVVVPKSNTWATCLTVQQLNKIWAPDSTAKSWKDIDPTFPDVPLALFGPGTDSGTFDYFTKEINGEEGASRTDYTPSEDDNVIVVGVSGSEGGLGYFGYTYYEENMDVLNPVAIDSGAGCVLPSVVTAQNGTYVPLSRPLFIYPSVASLKKPEVKAFFDYLVTNDVQIATDALFIPLNADQKDKLVADYNNLVK